MQQHTAKRKKQRQKIFSIALLAFVASITLGGGLQQVDAQVECPRGSFYDEAEKSCLVCESQCGTCTKQKDRCLTCADSSMIISGSECLCPAESIFDEATATCQQDKKRLKFSRFMQAISTTQTVMTAQVIQGNQTYDGVEFRSWDDTFASTPMITVSAFVPYLQVTFRNSIIDVKGHFFQSLHPVNLKFDNCLFLVGNTTALVTLDYSTGSQYGCTAANDLNDGDLAVMNSNFTDTAMTSVLLNSATPKYLFKVTSLYDFSISNVLFNGLKQRHSNLFLDHHCSVTPKKAQKLIFDRVRVVDSNFNQLLNFTAFKWQEVVPSEIQVHISSTSFNNYASSLPWMQILLMRDRSSQTLNVSGLTSVNLVLEPNAPLVQFLGTQQSKGTHVVLSQLSSINSKLTDFAQFDTVESVTATDLRFDSLNNQVNIQTVADPNKNGLISLTNVKNVIIDGLLVQTSSMTLSPVILTDSVTSFTIQNSAFASLQVTNSDLIIAKKPAYFYSNNVTVTNVINSKMELTKYVYHLSPLVLIPGVSGIKIEKPTMRNSQIPLIRTRTVTKQVYSDTSKYPVQIQFCTFSNNLFTGFDLIDFVDLPTAALYFENNFCFDPTKFPACSTGQYFDTILKSCTQCSNGCSSCSSESLCTSCTVPRMTVDPVTGGCVCPFQEYYFEKDGNPRCRQCLSKCQTCNNEYQCLTYKNCPNSNQMLNLATQQCQYLCTTGYLEVATQTCKACSDSNCAICDKLSNGTERCGLCQNGYFLDMKTYTCQPDCPTMSKKVESANTFSKGKGFPVKYCRPFVSNTPFEYVYYIDPNSTSHLELGTFEYPFKNMDSPAKEIFNFMFEIETNFTVYHRRGTFMKHYYGIMPITVVNVKMYTLLSYGDASLPRPRIYVTGHDYLWPDSTLFSTAEILYDYATRVQRGDMEVSESTKFFLKFSLFRSSLTMRELDFQSIMFGDAWSNPLIFSFDAPNRTVLVEDCYFDLDGAFYEAYFPISLIVRRSHFNVTNYQYGVWNDFRWDCYANNATNLEAKLILEENLFTEKHQQALYNFFYFSSFDDFILRNNVFDRVTYMDMETRPFIDVHPQSMCDPDFRTQHITIDQNKFKNLDGSSLMFAINYMNNFNGTKIFSVQNNVFEDSIINSQLISMQIQNPSTVIVGNNLFRNVTILKDKKILYFFSERSNITIRNETLIDNTLDDLYTIGNAMNVFVDDFTVINNDNTGAITETSAILRISTAANLCQITRFNVRDSIFRYGKAIEIEQARILIFSDAEYYGNTLQNQDFFVFNQIVHSQIKNLRFLSILKTSDKSRYTISMPTLSLMPGLSSYSLSNITFTNSKCSFMQVNQVQTTFISSRLVSAPVVASSDNIYRFNVTNCTISQNVLASKDPLLDFGEINYQNFSVNLKKVNIIDNNLELGTIYQMKLNCREFIISDSQILRNAGQFALLEPASSDDTNPLKFFIYNSQFISNFARADAMIQLTSNSALRVNNSRFIENFSVGRGSVVFADYQLVYVLFENCDFIRNYAYQGGAFYVQYSSQIEVSNCYITQNFAVTGGVAYVNNDGQIKINKGSRVFQNSALNSCFLFLINSQYESQIDNITITANDQNNALIEKSNFLTFLEEVPFKNYLHFRKEFFQSMNEINEKVTRTINERADTAIYAIKAKINLTNTEIYENDVILSASTESVVSLVNTTIRDIKASSRIITAVSSIIEFYKVQVRNITVITGFSEPIDWQKFIISDQSESYLLQDPLATSDSRGILIAQNSMPLKHANGMINNVHLAQGTGSTTPESQEITQSSSSSLSGAQWSQQSNFQANLAIQISQAETEMAQLVPQSSAQFFKFSIVNKSFMRALNCSFDIIEGAFLYASGSTVDIEGNSTLQNFNSSDQEQELFMFDSSLVQISDANFKNLYQGRVTPILRFQESQLSFNRGSFSHFNKVLFFLEGGTYQFDGLHVSYGQMVYQSEPYMVNSIVFDVSAAELTISNAVFVGIFSKYSSPIIYIENDPQASEKHSLSITGSRFANNVANDSAGVLMAVNTNVTVDSCTFENNTAQSKDGGALYLDCQDTISTSCSYNISNSIFKNNRAGVNGGAIKYTFYAPNISHNNSFTGNQAKYGPTLASYPVQMRIVEKQSSRLLSKEAIAQLNLPTTALVFELDKDLQSGALMTQEISFQIMDEQLRKLNTDNTSVAVMSSQSPNVTVMKSKSVKSTEGVLEFNDVIVVGPPGTDMLLKVTTDSISKEKIEKAYPGLLATLPEIYIKGRLRLCLRGEFQTTDFKCIQCSEGFFTLQDNQVSCQECPENAVCSDGYNIALDQGYWRNSTESISIFECYNKDACMGTNSSACATGYTGNLCHSCGKHNNVWYQRESNNECAECLNYSINSVRLSAVTIVIVLYLTLLIWVNISAVEQGNTQRISTVCMRILTNYFQILTLASSYDLSWSDNMKTFLQWISIIAKSSQILFSVDCFIKDNDVQTEPLYFKMVLAIIFPAVGIILISAFWFVFGYFKQNTQTLTRLIMSVTILIFITLPAVTTITFAIYNCVDVFQDDKTYLALDVSLQCWIGDHNFYARYIGIPIIMIWVVGLPLLALIVMYRQRKSLADESNVARYGFLYTGLNHSAFYWEILLHFRKVIMICINLFLTTFKPLYRALIGFMLMIIYIEVLQKVQPYSTQEVNDLEFKANIAAFATFYGGLFFISPDLHFSVTLILFLMILAVNAVFWWTWIRMMCLGWIRQKLGYYLQKLKCCRNSFLVKVIQGDASDINQINAEKIKKIEAGEIAEESHIGGPYGDAIPSNALGGPKNFPEFELDQDEYEEQKINGRGKYDDFENDIVEKAPPSHQVSKKSSKSSKSKGGQKEDYSPKVSKQQSKKMYKTVDQTQFLDMSVRHGFNNQLELDESRHYDEQDAPRKHTSKQNTDQVEAPRLSVNKSNERKKIRRPIIGEDDPVPTIRVNGEHPTSKRQLQSKTLDGRKHQDPADAAVHLNDSMFEDSDQEDQQQIEGSGESSNINQKRRKKVVKRVARRKKEVFEAPNEPVMLRKNKTINNKDDSPPESGTNTSSLLTDSIHHLKGSTPGHSSKGSGETQMKKSKKSNGGETTQTVKTKSTNNPVLNKDPTPASNISSPPFSQQLNKELQSSSEESAPKLPLIKDDREKTRSKSRSAALDKPAQLSAERQRSKRRQEVVKQKIREVTSKSPKLSNTSQESPRVHPKPQTLHSEEKDRRVLSPKSRMVQEDNAAKIFPVTSPIIQKPTEKQYHKQMEKKGRNQPDESVKAQRGRQQPDIDLSNQQAEDQEESKNAMNRTAQEKEKLFNKQRINIDKTVQNLPKREQYKKMQSRKISSHDEASDQAENISDAEETQRQMLSKPQPKEMTLRSKSRGSKNGRQNIDDEDQGLGLSGPSKSKTSSSGGIDQQANQQQRKVSKLRPKHMRNEAQEATRATPSMFTKPKPELDDSDNDEDEQPVDLQKSRKQRQEESSPSPQPQPQRDRKSKTREGGRRDKSNIPS